LAELQSKEYGKILKGLEKELSLIKEIGREREKLNRQEHIANIQKSNFAQVQRAQGWGVMGGVPSAGGGGGLKLPPVPPSGGSNMPKGGITSIAGLMQFLGVPGMVMGGLLTAGAAVKGIETSRRFISESGLRARETEASAFNMQGQGGQRLQSFMNGGASEELMFNPQRLQAAQFAQSAIQGRYGVGGSSPQALISQLLIGKDATGALQHGQFGQALRAIGG
jgi:hypothetical protein